MKWISKKKEPNVLAEYRNTEGSRFNSLPKGVKKAVRNQLLEEQTNLCAYCGARITAKRMKIEHWSPQSIYPECQLDYKNLLAVCLGNLFCNADFHCDTSKGNTEIILNPLRREHVDQIFYGKASGRINANDPVIASDLVDHLNLNCNLMVEQRSAILLNYRNALRIRQRKNQPINFTRLLAERINANEGFNDIVISYLRNKL